MTYVDGFVAAIIDGRAIIDVIWKLFLCLFACYPV